MRKILFLLLLFLAACAAKDFDYHINSVKYPDSYSVRYVEYNSGFAGADDTGESFENHTYMVVDEIPNIEPGIETMSDILGYVKNINFNQSTQYNDAVCYYYQQWGLRAVATCFKDKKIVVYHELETKGNHQSIVKLWKLSDFDYPKCELTKVNCNFA